MPVIKANGIDIAYEDDGPADGPVVIMIMGLGVQLTAWPPAMFNALNETGFRTIRFDNRDIGLSGRLEGRKAPNIILQTILAKLRIRGLAPYALSDMAQDTLALAGGLGADSFHLVGLSMGGMIGQIVAAAAPEKIKSFTAVMTSTNNPGVRGPRPDVIKMLMAPGKPAKTMDEAVERAMNMWNTIGTVDGGGTQGELRQRVQEAMERCNYPAGIRRQTAAIIDTGDLRKWTRKITAPTLVMHGTADPLINVAGGKDIAGIVEGSRLHLIEGLGHDLPPRFLGELTSEMSEHLRSVEASR